MKYNSPLKILVITHSNIFFECIRRLLIFTLKSEFIQNDDFDLIIKEPDKLTSIDILVMDYRFKNDIHPGMIDYLIKSTNKSQILHLFVGSGSELNSTEKIRIIRPDTGIKYISDINGTDFTESEKYAGQVTNTLTKKENIIADLISKGLNNKQIAENQNISEKTVKAHLTSIYRKLHLKNRFELMLNTNRIN